MSEVTIDNYEHFMVADIDGNIKVNVVYTDVDGQVVGCFSGYAGGLQDYRFLWLNDTWEECIVTDDEQEFDAKLIPYFLAMQRIRSEFENWDDDEDGSKLSEKGKDFLKFTDADDDIIQKNTENFEFDVVEMAQDQWSLHYYLE